MMVIGLDCAPPELVFDRYRDAMPSVARLMQRGMWGPLRSSEPPITVPAWTCMVSGRDPGELGLYGFRNRVRGDTKLELARGEDVRVKRVWDWLGEHGYRVAPLFVPLTSPPRPVRGVMVSCFMHPGAEMPWCFPRRVEQEIESRFGSYLADVADFRTDDLDRIYRDIVEMTDQHFEIARWTWKEKEPDFLMMVEIGLDRFHHAFWRYIDASHPRHEPGNPYEDYGRDYYARLDGHIARLCEGLDDDTVVVIVSDHGARAMHGGFCINEWLVDRGYLVLRERPSRISPLRHELVDWTRTRAWAEGGYYARIFVNVRGREPRGAIEPDTFTELRNHLRRELESLEDERGTPIATLVRVPEQHYRRALGFPPDLMVYFRELELRAIGSIGHDAWLVPENDKGPDSCNHAWNGIFIASGGGTPARGEIRGAQIDDVTPTILAAFDIPRPPHLRGRNLLL